MVSVESHFSPLPPLPVAVRLICPAAMVTLASLDMQVAPFTSWSSLSHFPLPLLVIVTVGADLLSSMVMLPSHFSPFEPAAVTSMVSDPPDIVA